MKINFRPLGSFTSVVSEEVIVMSKQEINQKSTELVGVLQAISIATSVRQVFPSERPLRVEKIPNINQ